MWLPTRQSVTPSRVVYHNAVWYSSKSTPTPVWFYPSAVPIPIGEEFERFEALNSSQLGKRDRVMKPCQHYISAATSSEAQIPNSTFVGTPGDWWENTEWCPVQCHEWMNGRIGSGRAKTIGTWPTLQGSESMLYDGSQEDERVLPPPGMDQLVLTGLSILEPQIRANLSLFNSIYELKDFKTLPTTVQKWRRIGELLKRARALRKTDLTTKWYRKFRAKHERYTLKQLAKAAADGYLLSEFAIRPLVTDVLGLYRAVADARKQLDKLRARAGRRIKSHWVKDLKEKYPIERIEDTARNSAQLAEGTYDTYTAIKTIEYDQCLFTLTLDHSYDLEGLGGMDLELAALLDVMGLNLSPAIIWNALPWSFVLDWVVGVGRKLDSLAVRNVKIVPRISEACWSWNVHRRKVLTVDYEKQRFFVRREAGHYKLREVSEVAYRRDIVDFTRVPTFRTSGISMKEFSLAAALGVTRLK